MVRLDQKIMKRKRVPQKTGPFPFIYYKTRLFTKFNRSLGCSQSGNGNPEWRTAYISQT
jgi:hypothetical protein